MTAEEVIELLKLDPHPVEGGFFRETYRSRATLPGQVLPDHGYERSVSTAIYYLLTPKTVSALHRLPGDEVFHFYLGDPVNMLQLWPDGSTKTLTIGNDLAKGHQPQLVVPAGVWQGSVLQDGGKFALLGATMAPGFDFADYVSGLREELTARYPGEKELIARLTD
ncbi:cupin domain-containing protein [Zavarzinella formosa]|uniref:cupin domain-containing protein n=1 Tax=Zavarzinella formosa TaxID=360055 RepID=UPI0002DD5AD6|nr:cupin domain-containing protein [Zavarzinella formosa]